MVQGGRFWMLEWVRHFGSSKKERGFVRKWGREAGRQPLPEQGKTGLAFKQALLYIQNWNVRSL